jgi:hypothetical protein
MYYIDTFHLVLTHSLLIKACLVVQSEYYYRHANTATLVQLSLLRMRMNRLQSGLCFLLRWTTHMYSFSVSSCIIAVYTHTVRRHRRYTQHRQLIIAECIGAVTKTKYAWSVCVSCQCLRCTNTAGQCY